MSTNIDKDGLREVLNQLSHHTNSMEGQIDFMPDTMTENDVLILSGMALTIQGYAKMLGEKIKAK